MEGREITANSENTQNVNVHSKNWLFEINLTYMHNIRQIPIWQKTLT